MLFRGQFVRHVTCCIVMFCCFPLLTVGDILLPGFGNFEAVFHCEDLFLCWSSNCSFTGVNCWSHPIFYCTTVQATILLAFSRMLTVGATLFSMVLAIQATMLLAFSRVLTVWATLWSMVLLFKPPLLLVLSRVLTVWATVFSVVLTV